MLLALVVSGTKKEKLSSSSPNNGPGGEKLLVLHTVACREETAIPHPVCILLKAAVVVKSMYRGFWQISGLDWLKTAVF